MKPQILTREGFTVVGLKARGASSSNDFAALWQEFMPRAEEIRHLAPLFPEANSSGRHRLDGTGRTDDVVQSSKAVDIHVPGDSGAIIPILPPAEEAIRIKGNAGGPT